VEPRDAVAIPTLAGIAARAGAGFDAYREGIRAGTHHGGGDPRKQPRACLLGGTLVGGRHLEAARALAARFDVLCASLAPTVMEPHLIAAGARSVGPQSGCGALYRAVAAAFGVAAPEGAAIVHPVSDAALAGIEFYAAPLVFESGAAGFLAGDPDAAAWPGNDRPAAELLAKEDQTSSAGAAVSVPLVAGEDYAAVTVRLAKARRRPATALLLADPPLAAHTIPLALRSGWAPVFGVPQWPAVQALLPLAPPGSVAWGRVFEDEDFFRLSRLGVSLQVLDPDRPAFATAPAPAAWCDVRDETTAEPSDAELERMARDGRVLVSLAFWAGAVREIETLYGVFDLAAVTGLRCGVALTTGSLRWGGELVSLLSAPAEAGGVHPLVEPLLGCTGDGIAVEAIMPPDALAAHLKAAMAEWRRLAPPAFVPKGWWVTMDAALVQRPVGRRPSRIAWREPGADPSEPIVRLRYMKGRGRAEGGGAAAQFDSSSRGQAGGWKSLLRTAGADRFASAFRPFELQMPGAVPEGIWEAAAGAGLEWVLSKSRFEEEPTCLRGPGTMTGINYTSGRWDGWTPFETVNGVHDLEVAERALLDRKRPAWLLGSIDTCLWTMTGEMWRRAGGLHRIAEFCAGGGRTGRLVPARPGTLVRYARVCAGLGLVAERPWRSGAA